MTLVHAFAFDESITQFTRITITSCHNWIPKPQCVSLSDDVTNADDVTTAIAHKHRHLPDTEHHRCEASFWTRKSEWISKSNIITKHTIKQNNSNICRQIIHTHCSANLDIRIGHISRIRSHLLDVTEIEISLKRNYWKHVSMFTEYSTPFRTLLFVRYLAILRW